MVRDSPGINAEGVQIEKHCVPLKRCLEKLFFCVRGFQSAGEVQRRIRAVEVGGSKTERNSCQVRSHHTHLIL